MSKANTLIHLSILLLGMVLLPQAAFSETRQGASNVTELIKEDTKIGTGEEAVVGKAVEVHYTGWLYDPSAPDKKEQNSIARVIAARLFHFCWVRAA